MFLIHHHLDLAFAFTIFQLNIFSFSFVFFLLKRILYKKFSYFAPFLLIFSGVFNKLWLEL